MRVIAATRMPRSASNDNFTVDGFLPALFLVLLILFPFSKSDKTFSKV
jgi:hypothetical protein